MHSASSGDHECVNKMCKTIRLKRQILKYLLSYFGSAAVTAAAFWPDSLFTAVVH